MVSRLVAYLIASIFAVLLLATISPRLIRYDEALAVLLFGLVVGAINAYVLPGMRILTVPLGCLTLGLSTLVINVAVFGIGALASPGVDVTFWGALIGAIFTSVTSGAVYSVIDEHRSA